MSQYSYIVVTSPVAGKEDEFNTWYNEQHVPDVLKVPGFVAAQRFKLPEGSALPGQYLAIYEMETDDPAAVMAELHRRVGTPLMMLSDAMDMSKNSTTLCPALGARVSAITA